MKSGNKCGRGKIAWLLVVIGGLNWGLVGLGSLLNKDWNVVYALLGKWPTVEAIIYLLVGISTIIALLIGCRCKQCQGDAMPASNSGMPSGQ